MRLLPAHPARPVVAGAGAGEFLERFDDPPLLIVWRKAQGQDEDRRRISAAASCKNVERCLAFDEGAPKQSEGLLSKHLRAVLCSQRQQIGHRDATSSKHPAHAEILHTQSETADWKRVACSTAHGRCNST